MNKKFCQKCGKQIDTDSEFCPYCGAQQNQSDDTSNNVQSPNKGNNSNMITAFKHNWDNAFFISGRTSRANYWFNFLDFMIIGIISYLILGISGDSKIIILLYSVISALMGVINFTSMVRRLHDTNRSGHFLWLYFIPIVGSIVLLVLFAMPTKQSERFNINKSPNNIWYKKWWTWLIVAILAFMYFGMINGLDEAESSLQQQIEDSSYDDGNISDDSSKSSSKESSSNKDSNSSSDDSTANDDENDNADEDSSTDDSATAEQQNALESAKTYADDMNMSKKAVYDQLTSSYGGKFKADDAQYAIDNLDADWNNNALESAKTYSKEMHMSKDSIYDQLTSSYGAKFTSSEAKYAVDNLE